jgi:RNA polymerase sigma-70 factor (ECF subfamily)
MILLQRKINDPHLAEDTLNQAVITSLEHLNSGRISDPSQIAGYVFQVAMNHLRNHRRKMDERVSAWADEDVLDNVPDRKRDPLEMSKIAQSVREILDDLPTPRDREVVKRFYLDEEEKDAICRDLTLSPLHFDKVIFRARQRMRKALESRGYKKTDFFSILLLAA